ncbi:FAD-binding oxidoreductase [Microbacterium trichothecenolyticum]|uniref:Glycolate oxidase n=1 Tax=Microbacterium trichothecenolyticum TaxID=69370 RepID=A0ABU0TVR9_MICTR|nr:FAD-linked oxidase C-terminal domain-containing protein [Microbacterium trichothecenolyticum]MDQ1123759.1 glycolate oxidase [Microbacterium trichothecenolyticum]
MSAPTAIAPSTGLSALLDDVRAEAPGIEVRPPSAETTAFAYDAATAPRHGAAGLDGPAVAFPASAEQVQQLVRLAARHGVSVVPRGAGTGLSGGASAHADQLVITTERLNRIVEVSPADEVAVVEPGVLNAALNDHLAPLGLFYAPDPASWRISTIGGNIATNAGGLRCAKYGVTRESVLALDVVLADGSLVSIGHRSIKGVTGLDLVSLFVGSEGVLGIVVRATVRIRPLPVARRTVTAFFDSTAAGAAGIGAITASRVRPSVIEFLDEPTLDAIDAANASGLRARGASLLLIELDGFGIDEQTAELTIALEAAGARVETEGDADAQLLWELRRAGRRLGEGSWFVAGDIAVPKSRIAEVFAGFPEIEARYGVAVSAVSHAGDGNLHPVITLPIPAGADPSAVPRVLHDAADDLVRAALAVGGTVSGEHGIGTVKRELAAEELAERVRVAQLAIKNALDPAGLFNPGKAL